MMRTEIQQLCGSFVTFRTFVTKQNNWTQNTHCHPFGETIVSDKRPCDVNRKASGSFRSGQQ